MIYDYARIKKKCDVLASEIVRSRGKCERCSKEYNLQCAHIISRTYMATRFDMDNLLCLCAGCHLWWHHEPIEAARWLESTRPGLYDKLNQKRQLITKVDVQGFYLLLKQEKAKLDASSDSRG